MTTPHLSLWRVFFIADGTEVEWLLEDATRLSPTARGIGSRERSVMSKTANADDGTDNEGAAAEAQLDQDSSLQELVAARRRQLAQIEADCEQIKRVVGELVVGNEPHTDATDEVHEVIADTMSELSQEKEAVRLPEIIFALWLELNRVTGMLVEASEQAEEGEQGGEAGAGAEETAVTENRELGGPTKAESADDDEDDPMATSARMFQ